MRNIIVTGGGTGIGKAIAAAFAERGDQVVITGRRKDVLDQAVAELGANVRAVAFDAADPAQVEAALPELPERVDVLVNNAGGNNSRTAPPAEPGLAGLLATWQANLDTNLFTALLVTTAVRERLNPGARVVNFSSIAAHRGGSGSYGAAKAAVENWNLTLAQDLGPEGGTANVIAPGYISDTEFFGPDGIPAARLAYNVGQAINKRHGTPADIVATTLFLASPEAGHITAQVFHLDGGSITGR
ncbi:SDR family NAD(P)-dependent oxidoreductase [Kitasatospora viridis]|uniref:3-oxoacyl-[acyl-carrier protein] reductase n=1 Tax=Kitasatospora viridis TaxID=281105 RepID=A0A561UD81_9ACTN|nr:SDR family oxidoreductase [Kitasatospora viridis]TWF97333.1 3-oxoacyl-[acyl-carrier protein] reductase [Kitasatospora viridis]